MAQPEPKRWGRAALGGLLMALGGVLFRATRDAGAPAGSASRPASKAKAVQRGMHQRPPRRRDPAKPAGKPVAASRPKMAKAHVRTKPRPVEAPARTRYWPPPVPKPIAPSNDATDAETVDRGGPLRVDPASEKLGYEVVDTRPATLAKVMAFSVSIIVASIAGLFWFIGHQHRDDRLSPPLTPQQLAVIVPPDPHLQDHPLHDIAMLKQRESDLLTRYAWTDATHRTARIPIVRAQALVIGRPLDPAPLDPVPAARP